MTGLSRDDLIGGIEALIAELRATNTSTTIHIVGGAALALAHFERDVTVDIDARISHFNDVEPAIHRVAERFGWTTDWLNTSVANFWPVVTDSIDWQTIYSDGNIEISVAPADLLLAMKLIAARAGRDTRYIAQLIANSGVSTIDEADALIERFFPGDAVSDKAALVLSNIWARPLPPSETITEVRLSCE